MESGDSLVSDTDIDVSKSVDMVYFSCFGHDEVLNLQLFQEMENRY